MATTSTKPALSALKTPLSATYPSELRSPMVGTPGIKREEGEKTPITPPTAYLEFLKALSPALMTPLPSGASTKFTFERPTSLSTSSATPPTSAALVTDRPSPRSRSASSSRSNSCNCDSKPDMKIAIPPPSPYVRPVSSARTPRRLHIPQSPYSPGNIRSPMSAHSVHSPFSATASPREWDMDKSKASGTTRAVSVRQVVTRTVTYSRTPIEAPAPLDPAPRGKRRKLE